MNRNLWLEIQINLWTMDLKSGSQVKGNMGGLHVTVTMEAGLMTCDTLSFL